MKSNESPAEDEKENPHVVEGALALVSTAVSSAPVVSTNHNPYPRITYLLPLALLIWLSVETQVAAENLEQQFDGVVVAERWVQVVPQINGVVTRILFEPGQHVAQGDLMFKLDADALKIRVSVARAALAEAQAHLDVADDDAKRQALLTQQNAGIPARAKQTQIEVEIAHSIVLRREGELAEAELMLSRANIVAPISGTVGRPHVAPGAFIEAKADTVLAEIAQLDPVLVALEVPYLDRERALDKAKTSSIPELFKRITLSLQLPSGRTYNQLGVPEYGSAEIDRNTDMMTVWAQFPNPDNVLVPGLKVRVTSHLSERSPN